MGFNNQAFSLIELLITFVILVILVLMGTKTYNEQKKNSNIRIVQSEMTEVLRYAKMAKTTDGAYHQFLYQMGYTPKGKVIAMIGTGASDTIPCCADYPLPGRSPCAKIIGRPDDNDYTITEKEETCVEGFRCITGCKFGQCESPPCTCRGAQAVENYSYYNCKNDPINKATDNVKICEAYIKNTNDPNYDPDLKCDIRSEITNTPTFFSFSNCARKRRRDHGWCTCDLFLVGAKSLKFDEELTLREDNRLCKK